MKRISALILILIFSWMIAAPRSSRRQPQPIEGLLSEYEGAALAGATLVALHQPSSRSDGIAIGILSAVVCGLVCVWYLLWRRYIIALENNYRRMREIEGDEPRQYWGAL